MVKRMRIFAGPNGSGKSTVIKDLVLSANEKISLGVYVNADDIEKTLAQTGALDFNDFNVEVEEGQLRVFIKKSDFAVNKRQEPDLDKHLLVSADNILTVSTAVDSYLAADLAGFIRECLVEKGLSFTFETVLSHPNKIDFIKQAKRLGYKVYLYYVATALPLINQSRVKLRVTQNGHPVPDEVIVKRYHASLGLLKEAVKETDRAYVFDNSTTQAVLLAAINGGNEVTLADGLVDFPQWFVDALLH